MRDGRPSAEPAAALVKAWPSGAHKFRGGAPVSSRAALGCADGRGPDGDRRPGAGGGRWRWGRDFRGDGARGGAGAGADRAEAARRGLSGLAWSRRRCGSAGWRTSTTSWSRGSGGMRFRPRLLLASGPAAALLAAERTALNFLGHLSGVATLTARFVEAVAGTGAAILDTRKTTPGLRALEKAAVAGRRRAQPPHGPLRRDPDQGEPHRPRRQPRQGGPRRPQQAPGSRRSRSSAATSTRSPTRSAPAPTSSCSTTWTSRRCAGR